MKELNIQCEGCKDASKLRSKVAFDANNHFILCDETGNV